MNHQLEAFSGFARKKEGSTLIELALILPVLVTMLLGATDIGLLLSWQMAISESTRVGAQYASLATSTLAGIQTAAKNAAANIPGYTVAVTEGCLCGSQAGAAACSGDGSCISGSPITYITITATATLPLLFGVKGLPASMPARSVMRIRSVGGA